MSHGSGHNSKWIIAKPDRGAVKSLCDKLHISELLATLLVNRGIADPDRARLFLFPEVAEGYDPFLLPDMEVAIERIETALSRGEQLTIYGDYDVDGVTATALLLEVIGRLIEESGSTSQVTVYIPDRAEEGYGLNKMALAAIREGGTNLVITVDCGITADGNAAFAKELGMDMIITDHHEVGERLPPAEAVVNPKRPDSAYPFAELAGVGVAFKLAAGLAERTGLSLPAGELLELVALGTVADVVPLLDENRVFTVYGLRALATTGRPGLAHLIRISGVDKGSLRTGDVAFGIAPRLNAGGRIASADIPLKLLMTKDESEGRSLAEMLNEQNRKRQELEQRIVAEAVDRIEAEVDLDELPVIVLAGEGWPPGVVGLVASRLVERYYRPALVISLDGEEGRGSARSIPGLDMYRLLAGASSYLKGFGGHKQAAGFTISKSDIPAFSTAVNHIAREQLSEEDLVPKLVVDCACTPEELSLEVVDEISRLEPFGLKNRRPLFVLADAAISRFQVVGNDKSHLKLKLKAGEVLFDGISFGNAELAEGLFPDMPVDIVFSPGANEWNGNTSLSLEVIDLRAHKAGGLTVIDNRDCPDKPGYLNRLLCRKEKTAVLVVNGESFAEISGRLGGEAVPIGDGLYEFGNLTLIRPNELKREFAADHLVIYDLPFARVQLEAVFSLLKEPRLVHLIYGREDLKKNMERFKQVSPNRTLLEHVYRCIKTGTCRVKEICAELRNFEPSGIKRALQVLEEAGFVGYDSKEGYRVQDGGSDLSGSNLYRKWKENYRNFRELSHLLVSGKREDIAGLFLEILGREG